MNLSDLLLHTTIFIYPVYFNIPYKDVSENLKKLGSLWEPFKADSTSSEYIYLTESARNFLFNNLYNLINPEQFKTSYKGKTHQLNSAQLILMPNNIAVFFIDLNFSTLIAKGDVETIPYTINDLLNFNESFRYIANIYQNHSISRRGLTINSPFLNFENGLTEDFIDGILNPVFSDSKGVSRYQRLFDERMITFSIAYLKEKPSNELAYKFFNVDPFSMELPDEDHVITFLKNNTYRRWKSSGILYGFTHYGGGCLVWDMNKQWLMNIFRKQYTYLAIILFFQYGFLKLLDSRISSFNVRNKIRLSEIEELFIEFAKDHWFMDITNQDQGREIYKLWRDIIESEYNLWERINYKMKLLR